MILKNGKRIDGCTDTLPVGTVQPFLGLTPPLGYLICQGQLISKVEYPELYNICKSTFGTETETHFYLPDLRGKTIAGYHSGDDTFNLMGLSLGEKKHLITQQETGVREHTHQMRLAKTAGVGSYSDTAYRAYVGEGTDEEFRTGRITGLSNKDGDYGAPFLDGTRSADAVEAHNNIQPTMVLNWIVKAAMLIPEYFKVDNTLTSTSSSNALSAAQGNILNSKIDTLSDKVDWLIPFHDCRDTWTWGALTSNNGYTPLIEWMDNTGGSIAYAVKDAKVSVQIDGDYYQGEGKYRVLDTRDQATSYAFYKWPSMISISSSNPKVSKEFTITTKRGNPVLLLVTGDNNPQGDAAKKWFNINFYRNGTLLCHQICESHEVSHNIPFSMQYLDVVDKGTYTYKVEFTTGAGQCDLGENGSAQTPNFTVLEI